MDFLLDSYAAKSCSYALHLQRVEPAGAALPPSDLAQARMDAGIEFEAHIGELIIQLISPSVRVMFPIDRDRASDPDGWAVDRRQRLEDTMAAMDAGVALIWNPRLPPDQVAKRSGEPDLLIRYGNQAHDARYLPIDVKHHHTVPPHRRGDLTRPLVELLDGVASSGPEAAAVTTHVEDLLQLAHYWRMLEACDRAPDCSPTGAVVGTPIVPGEQPRVTWFDLDEVFEEYEENFSEAVQVVERALQIADGADLPIRGAAWYQSECHDCGWRAICGPRMLAAGNVSLIKPDRRIWSDLEELEIADIETLASYGATSVRPDGRLIGSSSLWMGAIRKARMARAGDPVPFSLLSEVAGKQQTPRLWRRGDIGRDWVLPRADVELDIDMESATTAVYLWGTLLTYRDPQHTLVGFPAGYRGFGDHFPEPGEVSQLDIFCQLWEYLRELRSMCAARGLSVALYCYAGPGAEIRWMRHCARLLDGAAPLSAASVDEEVLELVGSSSWVDLYSEMRTRVESLNGLGLKVVAKALGFHWEAEDAGGEASMLWYERATHGDLSQRQIWQEKILRYNEDDVRATLHVREWFAHHQPTDLPVVPDF